MSEFKSKLITEECHIKGVAVPMGKREVYLDDFAIIWSSCVVNNNTATHMTLLCYKSSSPPLSSEPPPPSGGGGGEQREGSQSQLLHGDGGGEV